MAKRAIKLTESDLIRLVKKVVKENKTKRKINESNEHLRGEAEDLYTDAAEIVESMYEFVKKAGDLYDKVEFDNENDDDYVVELISHSNYYSDLFYDVLKKSNNI